MHRKIGAAVIGLGLVGLCALGTGSAWSHGYTDAPISRQKLCANGTVTGCGDIQWEPQSVEGPKGFPSSGPSDGTLCAGGNSRFAQLDDPRGGTGWPATKVTASQAYSFRWQFTASHATSDFRYYITKQGFDPSRPLTRSALTLTPFLTVPYNGARPPATVTHQGTMPTRSGRHIILAVWSVADTGNAFYACSDVQF
ncbi:lytic polysaccharide monooxygenase auxiliary activity family 9 protein [Actinacidiphila sp. bgisy167]|uniref:lytic polysaccharide monooxygenase auxiliary activity family 9 protein n=1 Tax=Actinacidiphila sp. bgisy167 TaxID=3413797 RepID=UPI003D7584D8